MLESGLYRYLRNPSGWRWEAFLAGLLTSSRKVNRNDLSEGNPYGNFFPGASTTKFSDRLDLAYGHSVGFQL